MQAIGLKPNNGKVSVYRHIYVTVKDITLIKQYSHSKYYSLPSALADGSVKTCSLTFFMISHK